MLGTPSEPAGLFQEFLIQLKHTTTIKNVWLLQISEKAKPEPFTVRWLAEYRYLHPADRGRPRPREGEGPTSESAVGGMS